MPEGEVVIITCQKCGHEVGKLSEFKGRQMLIVSGIATTFWRGVCVNCGKEFHWDMGTKALAELINLQNANDR
jgi:hypothetical protein